jgi:NADH:ubiquinone oxidoreductase subunit 5 (subunit L)/multisubunit Na+/H+ antiporter MnhA subunit
MKKHNNQINNDFQSNGMKTIKILIFVVISIISIIYIPFEKIPFSEIKENISIFFDEILTFENKEWLVKNQYIILAGAGLIGFWIVNSLSNYYNSKEYKKIKKQRKNKVQKTTSNFVIMIVIILLGFFLIKSGILFPEDTESSEKTLLSMKKAPFVDYKSSNLVVDEDTSWITANKTIYEITTSSGREYSQVSKDQCFEKLKDDYYFKQYLTFYESETYMYNIKYLNTWFTEAEIEKICKFWEP